MFLGSGFSRICCHRRCDGIDTIGRDVEGEKEMPLIALIGGRMDESA